MYGTLVDIRTDEGNERFKKRIDSYFSACNVGNFWARYEELCKSRDSGKYCEIDLYAVFEELLGGADRETVLKAAQYFRKKSRSRLKVYRGARRLLKTLKENGAGVYLLTNAQSCFTVKELQTLRLGKLFDGILISSDFGKKKPSPEFFNGLIERYNLDVGQSWYVGNDISADIEGAKGVGLSAAYIKSGLSPESDSLERAARIADFATGDFGELSTFLIGQSKK